MGRDVYSDHLAAFFIAFFSQTQVDFGWILAERSGMCCEIGSTRVLVRDNSAPAAVNIYTPQVEQVDDTTYKVVVRGSGPHGVGLAAVGQIVNVFHG
jgi:hypothetical protein